MRKLLLVQFNSDMLNENENQLAKDYYNKLYSGVRLGYHRFGPTWEVPKWIAEVAYNFPEADVLFANSLDEVVSKMVDYDDLAFSALDRNKHLIRMIAIIRHDRGRIFIGGYCGEEYFYSMECDNIYWCQDVRALCDWCDVTYKPGVDYRYFVGVKTVARLTMSTGCRNRCKFCTVPDKVVEIPAKQIAQQIDEIMRLDSPLIYLDDKTFGQCANYSTLSALNQFLTLKKLNFEGFIIQTTPSQLLRFDDDFLLQSGIRYVELGIESYNDEILRAMNKPTSEKAIQDAIDKLERLGIEVIPNIMIGLPGENPMTYLRTFFWLHNNIDAISHVNVYTYVDYSKAETADENRGGDTRLDKMFAEALYRFGNDCLNWE